MFEVREKPDMIERALLVRFYFDAREGVESESLLEELGELVKTLGVEVVESVLYRSREMHKKFLCGTGKADELVQLAHAHECDVIVIDNGLAPSQQREWEKLADLCVIDREEVILDIFAKRLACDGHAVAIKKPLGKQRLHEHVHTACIVHVARHKLSTRLQIGHIRCCFERLGNVEQIK